jgi:hypothetical protein
MNDQYQCIDGDDHVILLDESKTFKIGKFRAEIQEQFRAIAIKLLNYGRQSISVLQYGNVDLIDGQFHRFNWSCSPREGINCEILLLGTSAWQRGKLKITANVTFFSAVEQLQFSEVSQEKNISVPESDLFEIQVILEFRSEKRN